MEWKKKKKKKSQNWKTGLEWKMMTWIKLENYFNEIKNKTQQ